MFIYMNKIVFVITNIVINQLAIGNRQLATKSKERRVQGYGFHYGIAYL